MIPRRGDGVTSTRKYYTLKYLLISGTNGQLVVIHATLVANASLE